MFQFVNETKWNTDDLRKFFAAGLEDHAWDRKGLKITIATARRGIHIRLYQGSLHVRFSVPAPDANLRMIEGDKIKLAQFLWWGIGIMRGVRRKDLRTWYDQPVMWARTLEINRQPQEPTTSRAERLDKLKAKRSKRARAKVESLEAKITKLERDLKRARKLLTKARQRVRYYDKQELDCDLAERIKAKLEGGQG